MTALNPTQFKVQAKALFRLAGPLIVNNLAVAGMQFTDAVMAGSLGPKSLAAVAVGGSLWFFGFSFCLGILIAISPIVSRHFGAGRFDLIGRYTRQGLYMAVMLGIPIVLIGQFAALPLLTAMDIDPDFRELTAEYVAAISLGAPGIFIFLALRFTNEGIGHTRPIMYVSLLSLACNVFFNYVLMFGHFGAPELGAVGCGYASAITMWFVMASLAIYMLSSPRYRKFNLFAKLAPIRLSAFKEIFTLGVPIAITISAEGGLFSAIGLLMGTRGIEIAAGHHIAISFASTMFMVPLALSAATTVRVGQLLGAEKLGEARSCGISGILLCAIIMAMAAVLLLTFRHSVVGLYTTDSAVISIAIDLFLMAAIFQIADGIQIGAVGALRGYKDTTIPMFINVFAFWVLAFPLAYMAAVTYVAAPVYVWVSFIVGLSVSAMLLSRRYHKVSRAFLESDSVVRGSA
jgi:MATE family multidrug resistance protein